MSTVKISDVAKAANVSSATVSRVLSNSETVRPATREHVLAVMKKLNYQPNALARQLRTQATKTVIVIVPDIRNLLFHEVINGIEADKPIAFIATPGGVLVKCSEPHHDVVIYTAGGQLVRRIAVVNNDDFIYLPQGVYIMRSASSRKPSKMVIR